MSTWRAWRRPYCSTYLVLARTLIALNKSDDALRFLARLLKMAEAAGARLYIVRILFLQAVVWRAQGKRDQALTALGRALKLEVLRLLSSNLLSVEIAGVLVISANTVRSHIKSIYGTLNVHQRAAALERAKELGLL